MSFAAKIDYCGLTKYGLALRSNAQNATNGLLEIPASDGSYIGNEIYGHIQNPTCEYAISCDTTISATLGNVENSLTGTPYALQSITINTGAGTEPTVNATAVQIESGATKTICTYELTGLSVTPAHHAQTFGAFSYTESTSCVLQGTDLEARANIQPPTINGEPVASDATAGVVTVNATMWTTAEQAPTVTLAQGWTQTADWTCTGADSSLFSWSGTFTKYLSATH